MPNKRMRDLQRWLDMAILHQNMTPLEQLRHVVEQKEKQEEKQKEKERQRVWKRMYRDLAKKGLTREEVDESHRRVTEVIRRGSK